MRTHEQIIADAGGYQSLASRLGRPKSQVRFWERRKRIPARFWADVADKRVASLRELASLPEEGAAT